MLSVYQYDKLKKQNWQKGNILECCFGDNPDDPSGGDCCYNSWNTELLQVNTTYSEAEERARQILYEYNIIALRRDRLKTWYDELTKLDNTARKICDQLEVFINQIEKIYTNTELAVKASHILYCMIRDFYLQVDYIKTRYDQLMNCIRCLDNPALAPGLGIMKCLEEYYKKLDTIIKTRDGMMLLILSAIKIANQLSQHIGSDFGLKAILDSWRYTFNCEEECGESESDIRKQSKGGSEEHKNKCLDEGECPLEPMITFPICNDNYYNDLGDKYQEDDNLAKDLARQLLEKNKRKEELLACKQSLVAAINEVDPKLRCK